MCVVCCYAWELLIGFGMEYTQAKRCWAESENLMLGYHIPLKWSILTWRAVRGKLPLDVELQKIGIVFGL